MPKLTEAYILMFERIMKAYERHWAFKLAANLIGKAQQAYASLNDADASSYKKLFYNGTILLRRAIGNASEHVRRSMMSQTEKWWQSWTIWLQSGSSLQKLWNWGENKTEWQLWTCDEGLSHETSKVTGTGKRELPNEDEQAQEGFQRLFQLPQEGTLFVKVT